MTHKKPGYALVTTLIILSVVVVISTQLFYRSSWFNAYIPTMANKERARQLALSGLDIARAQLAGNDTKYTVPKKVQQGAQGDSENQDEIDPKKTLLKTLLSVQNRWQEFDLEEQRDGVEGKIKIYLTAEEGKISLSDMYDLEKKEFIKDPKTKFYAKDLLKKMSEKIKTVTNNGDLSKLLEQYYEKHPTPLVDITYLFQDKLFKVLGEQLFNEPNSLLEDLLTVESADGKIDPLLFSSAVREVFGLYGKGLGIKEPLPQEMIDKMVEKLSLDNISWEKEWDTYLKPIYDVPFKSLAKELKPILRSKFEPAAFSVVCYGIVGRAEQKLCATVVRTYKDKAAQKENRAQLMVTKLYWL